jgi:RNA recognition motif-containing protein
MNIYVGNLPRETSEQELQAAFEAFGEVTSAKVIKDRYSGESRGFGFVEMAQKDQAEAAMTDLNGKEFQGRTLTVNEARPRAEGRRGGGKNFGGGGGGGGRRRSW